MLLKKIKSNYFFKSLRLDSQSGVVKFKLLICKEGINIKKKRKYAFRTFKLIQYRLQSSQRTNQADIQRTRGHIWLCCIPCMQWGTRGCHTSVPIVEQKKLRPLSNNQISQFNKHVHLSPIFHTFFHIGPFDNCVIPSDVRVGFAEKKMN